MGIFGRGFGGEIVCRGVVEVVGVGIDSFEGGFERGGSFLWLGGGVCLVVVLVRYRVVL